MKKHVFVLILFSNFIFAQEVQISSFPFYDHEGLLIKDTYIQLTSDNVLWSSHYNGLIKHAGKHKIFFPFDSPEFKSPSNSVFIKNVDSNTLLCNNGRVIFSFNKNSGVYTKLYTHPNKSESLHSKFEKDNQGNFWATIGNRTLIKISKQGNKAQVYDLTTYIDDFGDYKLTAIETILNNGNIILKAKGKYFLFDFERATNISCDNIFYENIEARCHFVANGVIFPKNQSGSYQFEGISYSYTYLPEIDAHQYFSPFIFNEVIEGRQGGKYLKGTFNKKYNYSVFFLFHFNEDNEMEVQGYEVQGRAANTIISQDEILVPSLNSLNVINRKPQEFKKYTYLSRDNESLKDVSCRSIKIMNDSITYMLSSNRGFFTLEKDSQTFVELKLKYLSASRGIKDFRGFNLYGFEKLNDSILVVYGYSGNLYPINIKTKEAFILPAFENSDYPATQVSDIAIVDTTAYYLGTNNGIYEYKVQEDKLYDRNQLNDSININDQYVESLYLDKKRNTLWIGLFNDGGLYKKNFSNGKVVHFSDQDTTYPLSDNNISVIEPDEAENIIWVGTKKGLQKINLQTNESKVFDFGDPSRNYITGIVQNGNTLWVSTYNGLVNFNKNRGVEEVFLKENGLPDNEFNKKSFYKVDKDNLFFGGINGVVSFDPIQYNYKKSINKISIVSVSFYNTKLNEEQEITLGLEDVTEFIIPEEHNYLNIKLAYNDVRPENSTRFQYRFNDEKQPWVNIGGLDEINLVGISPGKHVIEIRGINDYGETSNILQYEIKVKQKLYKNPWVVFSIISLMFFFLLLFYRARRVSIQQRFDLLISKSNELQAQMNPHYIYNTLYSLQSSILLEDPEVASKYMILYANLMRRTLTLNREGMVVLREKIEFLESYLALEKLRLDKDFDYFIEVDKDTNIDVLSIPTLFIQPIVENAIIHGLTPKKEDRKLWIRFFIESSSLKIEIEDNGIGRTNSQLQKEGKTQRKSYGIQIMKDRLKILNAMKSKDEITFEIIDLYKENSPSGTKCILTLPVEKK